MIALNPEELHTVINILRSFVPQSRVLAFGSRVAGKSKPYSDLDLAIDAGKPLGFSLLGDIKDAFSISNLPFRVDVVDWRVTDGSFRKIILATHQILELSVPGASGTIRT